MMKRCVPPLFTKSPLLRQQFHYNYRHSRSSSLRKRSSSVVAFIPSHHLSFFQTTNATTRRSTFPIITTTTTIRNTSSIKKESSDDSKTTSSTTTTNSRKSIYRTSPLPPPSPPPTHKISQKSHSSSPSLSLSKNNNKPNKQKQRRRQSRNQQQQQQYRILNQKIIQCQTFIELFDLLESTTTTTTSTIPHPPPAGTNNNAFTTIGGGGTLNIVNFSTALNKLAKFHHQQQQKQKHQHQSPTSSSIINDDRFALLICSISEALAAVVDGGSCTRQSDDLLLITPRTLWNMVWSLTKLQIVPSQSIVPIIDTTTTISLSDQILKQSSKIRSLIHHSTTKTNIATNTPNSKPIWYSAVSELCGQLQDIISYHVILSSSSSSSLQSSSSSSQQQRNQNQNQNQINNVSLQGYSNLLWALATSQRATPQLINACITNLLEECHKVLLLQVQLDSDDDANKRSDDLSSSSSSSSELFLRQQEWANLIWALATITTTTTTMNHGSQQQQHSHDVLCFVANLLSHYPPNVFLNHFTPQHLSNTAWGVATLLSNTTKGRQAEQQQQQQQQQPPPLMMDTTTTTTMHEAGIEILRHIAQQVTERQADGFTSQALSNTAWALATVGFGLPSSSSSSSSSSSHSSERSSTNNIDDDDNDKKVMVSAIQAILRQSHNTIRYFQSQELSILIWSIARLDPGDGGRGPDTSLLLLLDQIGNQLLVNSSSRYRTIMPQDISTTLWSMATLEYPNKEMYRKIASCMTTTNANNTRHLDPQVLSNIVWALATAQILPQKKNDDPVMVCCTMAANELLRRPHEFSTQAISNIVWSFSKIGIRHPVLFQFVGEYLSSSKQENKDDKHRVTPQLQRDGSSESSSPRRRQHRLEDYSSQEISNIAWAFATTGLIHKKFLKAAEEELVIRFEKYQKNGTSSTTPRFQGQGLSNLLWAFATLNYTPNNPEFLTNVIEPCILDMIDQEKGGSRRRQHLPQFTATNIAQYMNRQALANLAWSCAVFGEYPPQLMKILYLGLLGVGEHPDPVYISQVHNDHGIHHGAVMALLYLQMARDLDGDPTHGLMLPPNFPSAWQQPLDDEEDGNTATSASSDRDVVVLGLDESMVNPSKIQSNVSKAFHRVGFSHIEEHIIRMDTLVEDYGIQMAPVSTGVLTLDMADVTAKIGIEVDGPSHFNSPIDKEETTSTTATSGGDGTMEYLVDHEMNGSTCLKHRLLVGLGWRIIHIPFWEWNALRGDPSLEEEYCRNKLLQQKVE